MHPKDIKIADYTYPLPEELIAQQPLPQRDASKLLLLNKDSIQQDVYSRLDAYLPHNCMLVSNQTKVIHARILFQKPTGGVIEVFCLEPFAPYKDVASAMLQQQSCVWKCKVGGASKWKEGMILSKNLYDGTALRVLKTAQHDDYFLITFQWDNDGNFATILQKAGEVPLPPYMHRKATIDDVNRYQTIFAKEEGSVAAPTAALHFSESLLQRIQAKGIFTERVTLHVGAGTFQPVKSATIAEHHMHAEWIEVNIRTIEKLLSHINRPIVAVGTTSLRTLESLYWIGVKLLSGIPPNEQGIAISQWEVYDMKEGLLPSAREAIKALSDWMVSLGKETLTTQTQILIAPGYPFKMVSGLVTNFHQPQSTLLLLVAALVGERWREVYSYALAHRFRFLSYGDGCLLWNKAGNPLEERL